MILNESIFRKKSLENISSPEKNDECIKSTRPGFWLVACAILMIISAILIWYLVCEIESEIKSGVAGENDYKEGTQASFLTEYENEWE